MFPFVNFDIKYKKEIKIFYLYNKKLTKKMSKPSD